MPTWAASPQTVCRSRRSWSSIAPGSFAHRAVRCARRISRTKFTFATSSTRCSLKALRLAARRKPPPLERRRTRRHPSAPFCFIHRLRLTNSWGRLVVHLTDDTELQRLEGGRATKRQPLILRKLPLLTEWQPFILSRDMHAETNRSFSAVPHPSYPVKSLLLS